MRVLTAIFILCVATLSVEAPAVAQEGHPLKGSWIGTWGPAKTHSPDLLLVMTWDGKAVTGMVNPGTDNMAIKSATLTPEGWVVRMQFDGKDASGALNDTHAHANRVARTDLGESRLELLGGVELEEVVVGRCHSHLGTDEVYLRVTRSA